jgi:hypothetical protein
MNVVATVLSLKGCEREKKWGYFVSQSTTTMVIIFPSDLGKTIIKSIEISSQCWLGITNGSRRPDVLIIFPLFYW